MTSKPDLPDLPEDFLRKLESVTGKRARVVIDHILEHGFVTTEELERDYGYSHPPRAVRDVRENGIPIETFRIKSSDGRNIAGYRFGNLAKASGGRMGGRSVLPKSLKDELFQSSKGFCAICNGSFAKRYLQIDHKIPFEIYGEVDIYGSNSQNFQLLCASCNRAKSWSCENCPNWKIKSKTVCVHCYWASPQNYDHIAERDIRRVDILLEGEDILIHNKLKEGAIREKISIPDFVKKILKQRFPK